MKYLGGCWVTYLYDNPHHIHLLSHEGTNSDRIFFDFCMIPKPTIAANSSDAEWHSYINHIIQTFPDGKIHWDGGNGAWIYGNQGLKGLLYGMKLLNRIPMVCFGHCEEKPNSWITRSPSGSDKLLWIRRFIKEFAKYMIDIIGIPEAIFEVWNEPIECMIPSNYATLAQQFGIALRATNYKLAIGSNDFRHLDWLSSVCSNVDLMKDVDYITTHYIWDEDWNLGIPTSIHGKSHIISECNFLKALYRVNEIKNLAGIYYLYLGKTEKLTWNVCDYPWTWDTENPTDTPELGSSYYILKQLSEEVLKMEYNRPTDLQTVYDALGINTPYHVKTPNLFIVGEKEPNKLLTWADVDAMEETRMKALIKGLKTSGLLPSEFPDYPNIKYNADGSWNNDWGTYAKSNPK